MACQNSSAEVQGSTVTPQDDNVVALSGTFAASQDACYNSPPPTQDPLAKSNTETQSHALEGELSCGSSDRPKDVHHRAWQTTFIRVGPLSGIAGMMFAMLSIVASLGILAGSDHQPVQLWSTPPSTYLAIFTALANLSMRFAALQGVAIAWWHRALSGASLSRLHYDWHAGTTLRGALTSGRRMGLLGVACIFSTVVVIDGPLLQRASTVILGRLDEQVSLNVSMAAQIPHDFSGRWGYWEAPILPAFNETVPTISGNASNYIEGYPNSNEKRDRELTRAWYTNGPLTSVIEGCVGDSTTSCRATISAPALFPTCITRSHSIDATQSWNWKAGLAYKIAPPPYALGFTIGIQLVMSGSRESISLVVANADMNSCSNGTLHYTICELQSGIGVYDVDIIDNEIQMENLPTPRFEALSNNTQVNSTILGQHKLHPSTLGGLVSKAWYRWVTTLFNYPTKGHHNQAVYETSWVDYSWIVEDGTFDAECPSYRNLTDEVLSSLNNLAVRMGALAAKKPGPPHKMGMDPGLSLHTQTIGEKLGQESKWSTDYTFFAAAAFVEIFCIALILPTYWGWWKIGRSVSLSPLETAKAFRSPLLADCDSNSSGRDIAKAVGEVRVQYGATTERESSTEQHVKLVFSDPACVDIPVNGSRYGA